MYSSLLIAPFKEIEFESLHQIDSLLLGSDSHTQPFHSSLYCSSVSVHNEKLKNDLARSCSVIQQAM
ncbi:hypothetical protein VNO80_11850 [Phaseolus coccineus]|uniref:Uncharacterized protein n=1 Tax=Phaseolus coccineus TaxID=3886 RepID=A0AAN9NB58_PHACN